MNLSVLQIFVPLLPKGFELNASELNLELDHHDGGNRVQEGGDLGLFLGVSVGQGKTPNDGLLAKENCVDQWYSNWGREGLQPSNPCPGRDTFIGSLFSFLAPPHHLIPYHRDYNLV